MSDNDSISVGIPVETNTFKWNEEVWRTSGCGQWGKMSQEANGVYKIR